MAFAFNFHVFKPFIFVFMVVMLSEVLLIYTSPKMKFPASSNLRLAQRRTNNEFENAFKFQIDSRKLSNSSGSDTTDDFTYNNPDDTYSPSQFVEYGHKFTGKDFSTEMEYLQRLLYAPVVTFGLGFLAIFLLHFGLLCRCCFDCCRCLPNTDSPHFERDRFCLTVFYLVLCLLVLIIDQLVFLGNQSLDTGVKTIKSSVKTVGNLLSGVTDDSGLLIDYGDALLDHYQSAEISCPVPGFTGYSDDITQFTDEMDSLRSLSKSVDSKIGLVTDYIDTYAIFYRNIGLYVIWGLAIVCIAFFLIAKCCDSVGFTKFSIFFSTVTYLLFLILGVPWLLLTSAGGDLCMAPSYNIVKSIPMESIKNISLYYATCTGYSQLQSYLDQGAAELSKLNSTFYYAEKACPGNPDVESMQVDLENIQNTYYDVEDLLTCDHIQSLWFDVVNKGFCTELYQGIFYIWGSQLVTSFLLFALIVLSTFLYQYYDLGKVSPVDEDEEDDEEAHPPNHAVVAHPHKADDDGDNNDNAVKLAEE